MTTELPEDSQAIIDMLKELYPDLADNIEKDLVPLHQAVEEQFQKVTCPTCNGSGKVTTTVHTHDSNGSTTETLTMGCHICDDDGAITQARADALQEYMESWCDCGNESGATEFHDDTPTRKHHYTCCDCGGIVQEG